MTQVSDTDSYHTPTAYCLYPKSSCLEVALPGAEPAGRWHAVVFEVAHESSQLVNADNQHKTPLGCLVSTVFVVT